MPIFELDEGRPLLVQPMQPASSTFAPDTSALVADHLTALLGEQLFQVRVRHDDDDAPHLLALDAVGQPVVVDVVHLLDAEALVRALGFAGAAARLTRSDLARAYQGGREAFDADHAVFRDRAPLSAQHGPRTGSRLVLVCSEVDDDVSDALAFLRQPGRQVEVLQMGVVQGGDGRRYVDVSPVQMGPHRTPRPVEPAAMIVPAPVPAPLTVTGASAHEAVSAVSRAVEVPREGSRPAPVPAPRLPDDPFDVASPAPAPVRTSTGLVAGDGHAVDGPPVGVRPGERSPEGTRSEGTRSEGTRSEGTRSEGTRSEGTRSEGTRSEGTRSEGTRSEGPRSEDLSDEDTSHEDASYEDAWSGDLGSEDAWSGGRTQSPGAVADALSTPARSPQVPGAGVTSADVPRADPATDPAKAGAAPSALAPAATGPWAPEPAAAPAPRPAPTAPADVEATMRMAPVPLDDDEAPLEPPTRSGGFAPRPEEQRAAEQRAAARRRVDEITTLEVPRDADARAAELRAADEALARARAFDAARIRPARREPSPLTAPIFLPDRRADAPAPGERADLRASSGPVPAVRAQAASNGTGAPAPGSAASGSAGPVPTGPVPTGTSAAGTGAAGTGAAGTGSATSGAPAAGSTPAPIPTPEPYRPTFLTDERRTPTPATGASTTPVTGASTGRPSTGPQPTPARQPAPAPVPAPRPAPAQPGSLVGSADPDLHAGGRRAAPAAEEDQPVRDRGPRVDAPSASAAEGALRPATLTGVLPSVRPDPALAALAKGRGAVATLVWFRERRGQRLLATLRGDGLIELPGGRVHADPDEAAADAANAEGAVDGWGSWRVGDGGPTLAEATGVR